MSYKTLGQVSFFDDPWGVLDAPFDQTTVEPETGWTGEGYGYGGGAKTTPAKTPAPTPDASAPATGISGTGKLLLIAGGAFALMMILGGKKR